MKSIISDRETKELAKVKRTVDEFHALYFDSRERTWTNTRWLGVPVQKCPLDLWIYQEILFELNPDLIIESGTADGGSAFFLACVCDLIGSGEIVTIDIEERPKRPSHERITYIRGSSTDPEIVQRVADLASDRKHVIVILDSDHKMHHVLAEMRSYADMVSPGSYLIVEDGNVNGNPVLPAFGPGPAEAIDEFLKGRPDFSVDPDRQKFFMTFNPGGYLRRS